MSAGLNKLANPMLKKTLPLLFIFLNAAYSYVFLISETNLSSKSSALANSDIAMNKTFTPVYSNPADMINIENKLINLNYSNYFTDINLSNVTYYHPNIFKNLPMAISLAYLDYGDFTKDIVLNTNYHPFDMMFTLSTAAVIEEIPVGINAKYFYSSIDQYSSSGIAADISFLKSFYDGKINIAGGIYNLGMQLSAFNDTKEELPTSVKGGISNKLNKLPVEFGLEVDYYLDGEFEYGIGVEFQPKEHLIIRGGYDFTFTDKEIGTNSKIEKFSGTSLGVSIPILDYYFDFTYVINGELDTEFNISAGMDLNNILK